MAFKKAGFEDKTPYIYPLEEETPKEYL